MASIDERVVSMAFENAKFEIGVAQTMRTLTKLDVTLQQIGSKNSLADIEKAANKVTLQQPMSALEKLKARFSRAGDGASQGMNEIERAGNKVTLEQPVRALNKVQSETARVGAQAADGFNAIEKASGRVSLQGLTSSLEAVTAKFSVLQGAASVALGNVASQGLRKGASFAKSFSFGPILQGFDEYQTNLKSIQTIMANTEGQRISGLGQTNKYLQELNRYSDQTIYNFGQMARNIGTFTAAGVDLKTSTASIKGIANLAALSGSSSQQASTAMYQLSQAIAAGKVGLQDWNSVVNAGMGGRKFQNSLIQTGVAMGTIEKGAVKIDKATGKATINGQSFRESIMAAPGKQSWLTSEVLTGSLQQFTGDMTDAELRAKGFSEAQIKSIQATAETAKKAATEVKTLPQVFDVAKEAIGSGWSKTFQLIFGNFNEARKFFTDFSIGFNNILTGMANRRNEVLSEWKLAGGRDMAIEALKTLWESLLTIMKPVGDAFRDIFPAKTGRDLATMTKNFRNFTAGLKPGAATLDGLKRTARGFFAALGIGWYIVKKVVGVIFDLLGIVGKGSGGFLNFTGSIGDFITSLHKAIVGGDALGGFFEGLTGILRVPLEIIKALASAFSGLFDGADSGKADAAGKSIDGLSDKLRPLKDLLNSVSEAWEKFIGFLKNSPIIDKIGDAFRGVGESIKQALGGLDSDAVLSGLSAGLLGGILLTIKKAFKSVDNAISGPLKHINDILGGLTGNLKAMQRSIQAKTLLSIAAAIAILAAGIFVLSKIDPERLTQAMTAVAIGLGQLVAAMAILSKASKGGGLITMPLIAAALIELSLAVTILAAAMKIFATMSWEELTKGLIGLGGALAVMGAALKTMAGPSLLVIGPGLIAVALAMNVLAVAMKIFAGFSWDEIVKGLIGLGGSLIAVNLGLSGLGPTLLLVGPGLIAAAFGMTLLSGAVAAFGAMSLGDMAKGILGIAAALIAIGVGISAIPPTVALQAAGLTILAVALTGIAGAVGILGKMDVGTLVKGLVALGGALAILAIGLAAMINTIPGSVALLAAAAALAILAPTLGLLGSLEWSTILKGLATLALTLGVLSIIGAVASSGLLALGIALTALAIPVVAVGAGMFLLAKAFQILGETGTKAIAIMVTAITAFIAALPKMIITFIKGLVEIIAEVAKIAPQVVDSIVKIVESLIDVVIRSAPKLGQAIGVLVAQFLKIVIRDSPKIIQAGVTLILNLLKGIDQNISKVISRVASIVVKFLNGLAAKAPALTAAGARFLAAFLTGIAKNIGKVIAAGAQIIVKFLVGIGNAAARIVPVAVNAVIKFIDAIGKKLPDIAKAGVRLARRFLRAVADGLVGLAREGANALIRFMNRIAVVIENKQRELFQAGARIAKAIVKGFFLGLKDAQGMLSDSLNEAIFNNEGKHRAKDLSFARKSRDRGVPRRRLRGVYDEDILDEVYGPKKAHKKRGKESGEAFAHGAREGAKKKQASPSIHGSRNIEKPKIEPQLNVKPMLKKASAEIGTEGKAIAEKVASPTGIKIGGRIVEGLKVGLRGITTILLSGVTKPLGVMLRENKSLREFGKFLGGEFRQGLTGGLWQSNKSEARQQIEGAFKALKGKLGEENLKLRDSLKSNQAKLREAMRESDRDWGKIDALQRRIASQKALLAQSTRASTTLMALMHREQTVLVKLAANYEKVTRRLENARAKLNQLQSDRKQAIKSYAEQFGQLPDLGALVDQAASDAAMTWSERWEALRKKQQEDQQRSQIDQVALYKQSLREQIIATTKYMETLGKLRAIGLDNVTYRKLLDMGVAGQEFASQLLSGGKGSVAEINKLDSQLKTAAKEIAKNAGNELYNAGIQAAKGLVAGLKKDQAEIRKVMTNIARSLVKALKIALGIRSPSQVFAELGRYSVLGLAEGLKESTSLVTDAAANIGDEAADALTDSLANISDRIQNGVDTDITITPVLDLTQAQKDASKIQDLANVIPITAAASYGQAAAISETTQANATAEADSGVQKLLEVNFEQNNTSPESLNDVEIYRQTRNQLSQVKSVLGLVP